jgi:type I restriction-modification system DNA methylase subunit/predicted type IV restriction endonuclease
MKTAAPKTVLDLVERFGMHSESYTSSEYNETQVRREFIDPMFKALGWDIDNEKGYAEPWKEVVHEDAIKVGGVSKAPDYAFRLGGRRLFFLEAKKPAVNLKDDPAPAFQLRRYAWTAKLSLSILTDFEEFIVYDTRVRPAISDKPTTARILYIRYDEYPERWDDIASIFSPEAIRKGAFDKYVESATQKRGTAEVDDAFLADIEEWREHLARNVALRNSSLTQRELNFAVQRIIDRVIFLRICEDRGAEPFGRIQALLNGTNVYPRLCELFDRADERYNSGLFHFQKEKGRPSEPDELTPRLAIDDKVLEDIFRRLYYPESPYEFSVLPAEILGQVYERFLGSVIRLTPGGHAKVEEKPEVRKAGGVYYTPTYIVDYIVKHTVGKLLEGKTPQDVAGVTETWRPAKNRRSLAILDPACGSGSFLLGAYQFLLDWHIEHYTQKSEEWSKGRDPRIYQHHRGGWRLTTAERKRILLSNIFGVDIDPQAVEVTKLSLLLKVLEGENAESIQKQITLFHTRALPDLDANIKCGNSLIGPDFYEGRQGQLFDEEEMYRVNAFDWKAEFPEIMGSGGFDAVIGNPPWGGNIDRELDYFHVKFPLTSQEHTDSFKFFVENATGLTQEAGRVSMIVPNTLLRQRRMKDVRSLMLRHQIVALVDLGEDVFKDVVAPSCIFVIAKKQPHPNHDVGLCNLAALPESEKAAVLSQKVNGDEVVQQVSFQNNADLEFGHPRKAQNVSVTALGTFAEFECKDAGINYQRVKVGMQEKGKSDLAERLLYEGKRQKTCDRMYWKGSDIDRYWIAETTERFCRPNYREFLKPNEVVHLNEWVYKTIPKILVRQTADHIIATIDCRGVWFGRSIIAIVPSRPSEYKPEYLLGIFNSKYFEWLYHDLVQEKGRVFAQVKLSKMKQLPIRPINFSDLSDKARHDKMVSLVERMLDLHKRLAAATTDHERTLLERQIAATDREIDQLVYKLYGLTDGEIAIVEEATKTA